VRLARLRATGELTFMYVPTMDEERLSRLVRARGLRASDSPLLRTDQR
jgi:hypothetical protein